MKPVRINALTGLRALAMITIFCCHLSFLVETPYQGFYSLIDNGRFGVNFFLVLSGFLLAFSYSDKLSENNIKQDIRFVKKRISKIFIPYLITIILAIPLYIVNVKLEEGFFNVKLLICRLIINIGMIQSIIPFEKYTYSINEVSWFISTIFIIYLLTPSILRLNKKASKHYTLIKCIFLVFAILVLHCCFYYVIVQIEYVHFADRGLSIIYRNPLIRLFPFLLGIVGYNIFNLLGNYRIKNASFIEILGMAAFFFWWITAYKTGLPTMITECIDMLISMFVILIFVLSDIGIVSRLLSKEKVLYLGRISLEFYLIHYMVIKYGMIAAEHFGLDKGVAVLPLTIMYFVISLFAARLLYSCSDRLLLALKKDNR